MVVRILMRTACPFGRRRGLETLTCCECGDTAPLTLPVHPALSIRPWSHHRQLNAVQVCHTVFVLEPGSGQLWGHASAPHR